MNREQAEIEALNVLSWLAGREDLIPVFLGSTGTSESDMRERAGDADFLASVVDFVLMDDGGFWTGLRPRTGHQKAWCRHVPICPVVIFPTGPNGCQAVLPPTASLFRRATSIA